MTFFRPDSQDHALLFCWETFLVLLCLHSSSLIPNFALVRRCPSSWHKQTLLAARSAASFTSLSLWLHTKFKTVFPGVSWALVFSFLSTAHHLSPLWYPTAFSPCFLRGLSLLDATSRGFISLPDFTQSQEHPLALDFLALQVTGNPTPFGLSF